MINYSLSGGNTLVYVLCFMYSCCVKNRELRRNKRCKTIFLVIRTVIGVCMKCIAPKSVMIKKDKTFVKHILLDFKDTKV